MKILMFTTFNECDYAYSINSVAVDQLKMFKRAGYNVEVIVAEGFKPVDIYADLKLHYGMPRVTLSNEGRLPDNYQEEVEKIVSWLREVVAGVDIVITHDIIYQPAHIIHNLASRKIAAEFPKIKWLHWIHSATSPSILCNKNEVLPIVQQPFPNSFICYPNAYDIPRVAKNFRFNESLVKHVPHAIDLPSFYGFHEKSKIIVDKFGLLDADIVMTYPVRLDTGKQVEKNVILLSYLKMLGKTVRLIVVDFHSTGKEKNDYRAYIKSVAVNHGISDMEIIFTSEIDGLKSSSPRELVRDMFMISNVFCLPSRSETYSLITQEAAACGNLLILNFDFPPMRSIYGDQWPLYVKFSSNIDSFTGQDGSTDTVLGYTDKQGVFHDMTNEFWTEWAHKIIYEISNDRIIAMKDHTRKKRNLDFVFKNYLEPLLYSM